MAAPQALKKTAWPSRHSAGDALPMMGTPKKKMKLVVANEDSAFAARLAAGRERFSRIVTELQQRAVRICASNNPRRATAMDGRLQIRHQPASAPSSLHPPYLS